MIKPPRTTKTKTAFFFYSLVFPFYFSSSSPPPTTSSSAILCFPISFFFSNLSCTVVHLLKSYFRLHQQHIVMNRSYNSEQTSILKKKKKRIKISVTVKPRNNNNKNIKKLFLSLFRFASFNDNNTFFLISTVIGKKLASSTSFIPLI